MKAGSMRDARRQRPDDAILAGAAGAPAALRRALALVQDALQQDPAARIPIAPLSAAAGVSHRTLGRIFRHALGCSPQVFVRRQRLQAARDTLARGDSGSVLDAAIGHGFMHPGRFAIAYARAFGERPSATLAKRRLAACSTAASPARKASRITLSPIEVIASSDTARARHAGAALAAAVCRRPSLELSEPASGAGAELAAEYRLQGQLDGTAITLKLVLPARGTVLWTARQSVRARDIPRWAERVIEQVRTAIEIQQTQAARRVPRLFANADMLVARARPAAASMDQGGVAIALDLLHEALHRDPAHALAHAMAGWCNGQSAIHHFSRDPDGCLERALSHVRQAVALGPDDPAVLGFAGVAMSLAGRQAEAERLTLTSLALDPDQPEAWRRLAWIQNYRGEWRQGLAAFRRTLGRWPEGRDGALSMVGIGVASFATGDYARSARMLSRALARQPTLQWAHRYLTPAAIHAGANVAARHSLDALRRAFPELRIADFCRFDIMQGEVLARMQEGHARAGLPH